MAASTSGSSKKFAAAALVLLVLLVVGGLVLVAMDAVSHDGMGASYASVDDDAEPSRDDDPRTRVPRDRTRDPNPGDVSRTGPRPPRAGTVTPPAGGGPVDPNRPAVVLTIRGSDGKLLSGAHVRVTDWENEDEELANGVTTRGGQLRLDIKEPRTVRVDARYGRDRSVTYVPLQKGDPLPLSMSLSEMTRVVGYVRFAGDDAPVVAAEVVSWRKDLDENEVEFKATTDASGYFELVDLPFGRVQTWDGLLVRGDGIQPDWFPFDPERLRDSSVVLTLAGGVEVRGRCIDAEGQPVADVWVRPDASKRGEHTDVEGKFRLRGMPESAVAIRIEPPGRVRRRIPLGAVVSKVVDLGDVVLTNEGLVSGQVFDVDGTPAQGADVMLLLAGKTEVLRHTQTDEQGHFTIIEVGENEYVLSVRGSRRIPLPDGLSCWRGARLDPVHAGDEGLQIHLAEPMAFEIEAELASPKLEINTDGEKSYPMVVVTAYEQPAGFRYANQRVFETGNLIVWVPYTGPWTIEVQAAGHKPQRLELQYVVPNVSKSGGDTGDGDGGTSGETSGETETDPGENPDQSAVEDHVPTKVRVRLEKAGE